MDMTPGDAFVDMEDTMERLGGDRELLSELFQVFIEEAPLKVADIEQALGKEDYQLAMKRAHALKGSSAAIGALLSRDLCFELEKAARSQDLPGMRKYFEDVRKEISALIIAIPQLP